jgi:hypothetical protein
MGKPALEHYELVKIACYSTSPTVAFGSARRLGWSKHLANSCRYLAIIMRDHGFGIFKFVVENSTSYTVEFYCCYVCQWGFQQMLHRRLREIDESDQDDEESPAGECFHFAHLSNQAECPICCNEYSDDEEYSDYEDEDVDENDDNDQKYESEGNESGEDNQEDAEQETQSEWGGNWVDEIADAIQEVSGTNYPINILDTNEIQGYTDGESIVLTQGLIDKCNTDELAFVIAHEVVHNVQNHIGDSAQLAQRYIKSIDDIVYNGKSGIKVLLGMIAMGTIGSLHYFKKSRDHERESDALAKKIVIEAGYSPRGGVTFLQRFSGKGGGWFDSHPSNEERIRNIKAA